MKRSSSLKSVFNTFVERVGYFGRNSSVQGLKYVFQENGTILSRLFWMLLLLVSTGCLYLLLLPVVQRGGSVSVTPDTRYLNWSTKFPGVTVCEEYTQGLVLAKIFDEYPDFLNPLNVICQRHMANMLYGRGSEVIDCLPCGALAPCNVTWRSMIDNIHKQCDELIADCYFNGEEFSCCEHFYTVDSEYGSCFSFNSLQSPYAEDLQVFVNSSTGPGVLSFHLLSDAQISVHSAEELSTNVLDKKSRFNVHTYDEEVVDYLFSIVEVDNEPVLERENINIRGCRYEYEIPDLPFHTYQVYSYGACRLAENTWNIFNICGCVHPVRDLRYKDYYCNSEGINCLVMYEVNRTKLMRRKHRKKNKKQDNLDVSDCLPSCMESELSTVHLSNSSNLSRSKQPQGQYNGTVVNIRMVSLPTMRYRKNLLRSNLDFVVTVGGMVGLFFSASILSLVEMFYLIFRSPYK